MKSSIRKGPKKVVMAVNASEVSKRGLDILLQFVNPRDTLILVHLLPDGASGTSYMKMQEYYSEELENYGPADSKFMFLERDRSIPVTHAITEFCNDMADLDLFAIAPRAKQDRSSVTDYIVNYVQCSVLLCKV